MSTPVLAPTGPLTLGLAALAVLLAVVWVAATWERGRRLAHRVLVRTTALATLVVVLVCAAGLAANAQFHWFSAWSDLTTPSAAQAAGRLPQAGTVTEGPAAAAAARTGKGTVHAVSVTGARSHVTRRVLVYLPAAYEVPADAEVRFPVVVLLHGYPGGPQNWTTTLHLPDLLDQEIAQHRIAPAVYVFPDVDGGIARDRECVDAPHGVADETFLAEDLPDAIARAYRTLPAPDGWAVGGYSTGAFCAMDLALRHPSRFHAVLSLSGYFNAITDVTTGKIYRDQRDRDEHSPVWLLAHRPVPPLDVLLMASADDPEASHALGAVAPELRPPLQATVVRVAHGGHSFATWSRMLPYAVGWLSAHEPPPAVPVQPQPDATVSSVPGGAPTAGSPSPAPAPSR